jgi:hypothetical protein
MSIRGMGRIALAAALGILGTSASGAQPPRKPLKVFILAGQSNMEGHAQVRTFDHIGMDPQTAPLLKDMRNADGSPRVCDQVWISEIGGGKEERTGKLTVGFGSESASPKIGPEFTFGIYLQKSLDEPLLLIKTAWGGKSLNTDFRPPSAGPYEPNAALLQRLRDKGTDLQKWKSDQAEKTGRYYRLMVEHVKKVLADPRRVVPGYDPAQGFQVAGFVWFQGWNDMVDGTTYPDRDKPGGYDAYSTLLASFIRDVRKDFGAPELPFVIGVMGVGGDLDKKKADRSTVVHRNFRAAMAAPASLPEFKGSVRAVQTSECWDEQLGELVERWDKVNAKAKELGKDSSLTPKARTEALEKFKHELYTSNELDLLEKGRSNAAYHYLGSSKIMARIGKAFAESMQDLLKSSK